MISLDRTTAYALRAALIAVLRLVEDAMALPDDARALRGGPRPGRRERRALTETERFRHD